MIPSARGFSALAEREIRTAMRGKDIAIPITPEVDRAQFTAALMGATAGQRGGVPIDTEVDARQLRREVTSALVAVEATDPTVTVDTEFDRDGLRKSITRAGGAAEEGGSTLSRLFTAGFGSGLLNPLIGIPVAILGALSAPAVAAATLAGTSLGAIFAGAFGLRGDKDIQAAATGLLSELNKSLTEAAAPLKGPFLEALGILGETVRTIGPDLREIFAAVAPYVPVLAEGVAGFVEAFTPGLVDAVKSAGPVIEKIAFALPDLGQALGQFLTTMGEVSPQAAVFIGMALRGIADIIRLSAELIGFLTGVFGQVSGFFSLVHEIFRESYLGWKILIRAFTGDTEALKTLWLGAVTWFAHWWGKLWGVDLPQATSRGVSNVVGQARALPGKIVAAVGNLSHLLWDAGRNILQGLIDGIKSKFPGLSGVMSDAAGLARSFWPFSPAERGPLSGHGSLWYAGQNLMDDLTGGMVDKLPKVAGASEQLAGAVGFGGRGSSMAVAPAQLEVGWKFGSTGDPLLDALRDMIRVTFGGSAQAALGSH